MTRARGKRQNVKKGFFMKSTILDFIAAAAIVAALTVGALAYFDVLIK
jgi:hypothetical protein